MCIRDRCQSIMLWQTVVCDFGICGMQSLPNFKLCQTLASYASMWPLLFLLRRSYYTLEKAIIFLSFTMISIIAGIFLFSRALRHISSCSYSDFRFCYCIYRLFINVVLAVSRISPHTGAFLCLFVYLCRWHMCHFARHFTLRFLCFWPMSRFWCSLRCFYSHGCIAFLVL